MSDSGSDTSVGSSPFQSDHEVMTYVMVGEVTDTGSGDTRARQSDDSNTEGLKEKDNNTSLDGPGCSTDTLQGSIVRLKEENVQLKKRIEELECFDQLSLASWDSGFDSETTSLASWGSGPTTHRRQQDKVGHVGKIKDNLKRLFNPRPPKQKDDVFHPTSVLRVGNEGEKQMPNATQKVDEPDHVTQNYLHADTDLNLACKKGDLDRLRRILSKYLVDVNSRLKYGRTPVMDDVGDTILHVACLGGHVDIVKYVLSQKVADINSRGQYGWTPLMVAAEKGHRKMFDLLVREGADVALVDDGGDTILHVACLGGHVDMVKYVLSQKVADINSREQSGWTPLMVAAEKGQRQVFDSLVREEADVSLVDDDGDNILHVASLRGHVDMMKYVLAHKVADINSRGKYGRTPLMVAAENGHRQVFDLLLTRGARVSFVDELRNSILHVACLGGHVDMVKYVLSQKVADINSRGKYGRTPLMVAAENGHRQVFDLLVTRGARVSFVDELRNSILHVACLGGHVDIVKYVLSRKFADINSRGQYGRTPLMVAAENGHRQVLDLLVTRGAGVSLVDNNRNNILHVACLGGHVDMVKYVLSKKVADINSRGKYGRTPLMVAAENGHRQVFDLLVTQGADVSLVDDGRNNILHSACFGGHVDMVKYVQALNVVDIDDRNDHDHTADDLMFPTQGSSHV